MKRRRRESLGGVFWGSLSPHDPITLFINALLLREYLFDLQNYECYKNRTRPLIIRRLDMSKTNFLKQIKRKNRSR